MKKIPPLIQLNDGSKIWENRFEKFEAKVYIPACELLTDIINYGFMAPYLLVFEENKLTCEEAKEFADESGLSSIAAKYGGSVVFVYPTNEGGWNEAPSDLFASIISETKISPYYKDGVAIMRNYFTREWGDPFIRGGIHRSYLYGFGSSADYIATHCLKSIEGEGLYGKGDITPVVCILEHLSVIPRPERRDIPVISIKNSEEINQALKADLDHVLVKEAIDYVDDFDKFIKNYRRMVGYLDVEEDLERMGLQVETDFCIAPTSSDNRGDVEGTEEHKIGYVAYYQKGILDTGEKVPLVLCFHGGGDSAMCFVTLSDWHYIVRDHSVLLISVDDHINCTATETMTLLEHLKEKYPIDSERIYATGFSMGGCKSWDLFQEYPDVFAAVAPMSATFDVGFNVFGDPVESINNDVILPVFYVGGEKTPLPELPFQDEKCMNRMAHVLKVNKAKTNYDVTFEEKSSWQNPIFGIDGDVICKVNDVDRGGVLTMHLFESENGCCYSVFASSSNQEHEMRYVNCVNAWKFMSRFRRVNNGEIVGGDMSEVVDVIG